MSDKTKQEIEELLSGYVDDTLTGRQQTELKRLLLHQPQLTEQLAAMRRLREMLSALPSEPAPSGLIGDTLARLERNQILRRIERPDASIAAKFVLWQRRLVTAAALVLAPLALLAGVIWMIVAPVEPIEKPVVQQMDIDQKAPAESADALMAAIPFEGVLTLVCPRPLLAAQTIEKEIFLLGLESQTFPRRAEETMTFQLRCSAAAAAELIGRLKSLWPQMTETRLTIKSPHDPDNPLVVEHILPHQTQALIQQPTALAMQALAKQYSASNKPLTPETQTAPRETAVSLDDLTIPEPYLAWPQTPPPAANPPSDQPLINLTITVSR